MASSELAAKKRKRRKKVKRLWQSRPGSVAEAERLCHFITPNGTIAPIPADLRQDFTHEGQEGSQSRINETAESSQIVPNPGKSSQIQAMNIVLQFRQKIKRLAALWGQNDS
jgi:hypothetical protein